jgi:hypothetical protein
VREVGRRVATGAENRGAVSTYLFRGLHITHLLERGREAALKAAAKLTEAQIAATDIDELTDAIMADKLPRRLLLDRAGRRLDREIVTAEAYQHFMLTSRRSFRGTGNGVVVRLHIPYTGTRQLFDCQPSHRQGNPPDADVTDREVIISVPGTHIQPDQARQQLDRAEEVLAIWVRHVNADVTAFETRIRGEISNQLRQRKALAEQADEFLKALDIPIRQIDHGQALPLPVRPVKAKLIADGAASGANEWRLTDAVYEQIVRTIVSFGHAMERRPASARQFIPKEETLRDWLIFLLNVNFEQADGREVFIGGETVNGKGKTDILVRHLDRNAFIGECKFWTGPANFDKAINQLLSYTVWRDTKAALLLVIKNREGTATIGKADARLRAHANCLNADTPREPDRRRDYRFASPHDEQRTISLALLPIVITELD